MTGQEQTMRRVRIEGKVVGLGVEEDVTQRIASFIQMRVKPRPLGRGYKRSKFS